MNDFRWLYVGSGGIANSTARSILRGKHKITAVYGRTLSKVENFAKKHNAKVFTNFDEAVLCDEVDGVYIATPHTAHVNYAVRAMELGKPVLCEKPVGVSVKDVDTLINSSKDNNVYFCEAMWTWFSDVALTVKSWINDKKIGDIVNVEIDYKFPGLMMPKDSRVRMPETAGGSLLDVGIYPITYCYNLFGYPNQIECNGEIKDGIDIKETVILSYNNFKCTLNIGLDSLKEGCTITGTKGTIKLPIFHCARKAVLKSGIKRKVFRGKTDYLTEFTRVSEEINAGLKESKFIPFSATRDCMLIMDECRRQMNLVYPFEKEIGE